MTDSLDALLKNGNISFFGYRKELFPSLTHGTRVGRLRAYTKGGPHARYERLSDIRDEHADVYFLDHEAIKVLFAEFPASAQYVLVRLAPRISWFVALPGLLRRLSLGLVSLEGVRPFRGKDRRDYWLVLKHHRAESLHTRLCLSEEIGITGLLEHLRKEKRTYVVLRFFESLPHLHRAGGDLDLLVSDEDERSVKEFLKAHPGPIGVDVWTVSRVSHNAITYYPPPLARAILSSRVDGPAGSFVPAPKEAFLSFAYHVVYHKGLFSGVPTTLQGLTANAHPENDYAGEAARLAKEAGIDVSITLESLDEYLAEQGWRPQLDTLAKIAPRNKWVWHRFFTQKTEQETGLAVIIIKRKAVALKLAEAMRERIRSYEGFTVLAEKEFSKEEVERAARELRGGVWVEKDAAPDEYLPSIALVVLDVLRARAGKLGAAHERTDHGIKHLKKLLRQEFSAGKGNLVHATDYTHEAWEYVRVAFPNEEMLIRTKVEELLGGLTFTPHERVQLFLAFLPRYLSYKLTRLRTWLRSLLVRVIMEK